MKEARTGRNFCLSMPLDLPGGNAINPSRLPPELKPVIRQGEIAFESAARRDNPLQTDLLCDDAMLIHSQFSTQWDSFAHIGAMFDADGDGTAEHVYYSMSITMASKWSQTTPARGCMARSPQSIYAFSTWPNPASKGAA